MKQGAFWGHLQYIDHGTGLKVKGTGVTAYTVTGATTRHIEGTADIDGTSGTYKVDVADNGEPGRGSDSFCDPPVQRLHGQWNAGRRQHSASQAVQ